MNDKAEFEKVIQGLGYVPAWDGGQYLYEEVEVAWQAWQAARAHEGGEVVGRICDDGLGAYVELHDDYSFTVGQPVYIRPSASVPGGSCEHGIRHPHPCRECEDREPPPERAK